MRPKTSDNDFSEKEQNLPYLLYIHTSHNCQIFNLYHICLRVVRAKRKPVCHVKDVLEKYFLLVCI